MTRQGRWRLTHFWPQQLSKVIAKEMFWELSKQAYLNMNEDEKTEFLSKMFNVEGIKKKEG